MPIKTYSIFRVFIAFFVINFISTSCDTKSNEWRLSSPDNSTLVEIKLSKNTNQLSYSIIHMGVQVVESAQLGITSSDASFVSGLTLLKSQELAIEETYNLIAGNKKTVHTTANELALSFSNKENKLFKLTFRAYNNAIAFNYSLFNEGNKKIQVLSENSSFSLTQDTKTWIQPYNPSNSNTVGYEAYYTNGITIDSLKVEKNGWSYAALFFTGKSWLFVTEAGLDGTSPASRLISSETSEKMQFSLAYPLKGESLGMESELPTFTTSTWESPWRVFLLADNNLSTLVESNIITSLNKPTSLTNTDWIRPGLSTWSWWAEPESPKEYASSIKYINFSSSNNIPYFLVDANWNMMQDGNIEQLISYAKSKNVGIWLWYNSGGKYNTVSEQPRDKMDNDSIRKQEFARISQLGVKGVKIDFFLSEKQHIIKQYIDILNDAAEYHLMVNFHGCTLPRGWHRTYPNLMTMEAVRGSEYYIYDSIFPQKTIWHNTVLAFTRNLSGPMDYTPMGLSNRTFSHLTTYANELAQLIIVGSGINHLVDLPQIYEKQPPFIKSIIANYPQKPWDDFKFISGYPGKEVILARKSGDTWYVAGINGEALNKTMSVALNFLNKNQNYHLKIVSDGDSELKYSYKETILQSHEELSINVLPNGGFLAIIN